MQSLFKSALFQHIAQNSNFAGRPGICQNAERRLHRLRVRVVGVIVKDDAVLALLHVHTHVRRLEIADPLCDFLICEAKTLSHRSRCHGRIDHVPAKAGNLQRECSRRRLRVAAHLIGQRVVDVHSPVVTGL